LGRDVVRLVQQARRDAGLDVSDRITLTLEAPEPVVDAVSEHETFVAGEVLATSVTYAPVPEPTLVGTVFDGHEVKVLVTRG
jgi:isoleucyl-tRNA synthetase